MQEGISYLAGAELPCVIVDVMRGGPGLGNIAPEQSDYFAMVKGGGHGNYRNLVLAPASVQEMADLTVLAFELADKYRNPVVILADGFVGQMMEPLELEYREVVAPEKAVGGEGHSGDAQESGQLDLPRARRSGSALSASWRRSTSCAERTEPRWELLRQPKTPTFCWSATASFPASCARRSKRRARKDMRVGLFRPITLWPFPSKRSAKRRHAYARCVVVELSNGQMVEDVRLAINGECRSNSTAAPAATFRRWKRFRPTSYARLSTSVEKRLWRTRRGNERRTWQTMRRHPGRSTGSGRRI